jgi:hypothetical protein
VLATIAQRNGDWVTTKRVRLNAKGEARFRGNFVRGGTLARLGELCPGLRAGLQHHEDGSPRATCEL